MEGWRDGGMEGWRDGRMDGWADGRMDGWTDGRMDGWTDGWMGGWTDGLTDGQTLLQTFEVATNNKLGNYSFLFILFVCFFICILMISGCLNVILRILKVYSYDRTTVRKVGRKPIRDGVQKRLIHA